MKVMDSVCKQVLDKIRSRCEQGKYVIFEEDELLSAIQGLSEYELDRALTSLQKEGYIDIRYAKSKVYCIAYLKEYLLEQPQRTQRLSLSLTSFLGALVGGAIVAIFCALF